MPEQVSETIGFIRINRSLFRHPLWKERRTFSKCEAWLDLISLTRFEQSQANELINGKLIRWGRGELVASVRFLAVRWDWGKSKVSEFMKLLEVEKMISRRLEQGETVITLLNYENHNPLQDSVSEKGFKKHHKNGQQNGQQNKPPQSIPKEPPDSEADNRRTGSGQGPDKTKKEEEGKEVLESKDSPEPPVADSVPCAEKGIKELYESVAGDKAKLKQFIRERKPDFIEPYVTLWNFFAAKKNRPKVASVTKNRKQKFKIRIGERAFDFVAILEKAANADDFLFTGTWFTFDWIIESEANYIKVLEGNYDRKPVNGSHKETAANNGFAAHLKPLQ